MSFLDLEGRTFLITGIANKRSVAYRTARVLLDEGAECFYSVRSEMERNHAARLVDGDAILLCDVEKKDEIARLADELRERTDRLDGFLHSIAFANYADGVKPIHEAPREDFLQAAQISCFSLVEMAGALKPLFSDDASVVTVSISNTHLATENYGYMGPVKAALDSSVCFLAQSFSKFSKVRFNAVKSGPLRTASSAGIPGYLDNYLYAEKMTLRKQAVTTDEVARTAAFLLSPASSGINAQGLVVDAGMDVNAFDPEIVARAVKE